MADSTSPMKAMPAVEADVPDWALELPGAVELYGAIKEEFPFMDDHCVWELVRNW